MTSVRDNSILLVISSMINIIEMYNIEFILTTNNLMFACICLSTTIYNYMIFNDLYFEIKYNLNLYLYPNFYPSSRKYNQCILMVNSFVFIFSSLIYCYSYWIIENNISLINNYGIKLINMAFLTIVLIIIIALILYQGLCELFTISSHYVNCILFNYTHGFPLLANVSIKNDINCWICNKKMLKSEYVSQLHCPCKKNFHSKCIERYLILYKNVCPNGHKIIKLKNEV